MSVWPAETPAWTGGSGSGSGDFGLDVPDSLPTTRADGVALRTPLSPEKSQDGEDRRSRAGRRGAGRGETGRMPGTGPPRTQPETAAVRRSRGQKHAKSRQVRAEEARGALWGSRWPAVRFAGLTEPLRPAGEPGHCRQHSRAICQEKDARDAPKGADDPNKPVPLRGSRSFPREVSSSLSACVPSGNSATVTRPSKQALLTLSAGL